MSFARFTSGSGLSFVWPHVFNGLELKEKALIAHLFRYANNFVGTILAVFYRGLCYGYPKLKTPLLLPDVSFFLVIAHKFTIKF